MCSQEVTHKWHYRSARGTYFLRDVDTPPYTIMHSQQHQQQPPHVTQIVVLPRDVNLNSSGKYVMGCKDNSIQVRRWDEYGMGWSDVMLGCHVM